MKRFAVLLVVLLVGKALVAAQSGKFTWQDQVCLFEGAYNASVYTKKQLENTHRLVYTNDFSMDTFDATAFNIAGIAKLRTAASLDEEYARKAAQLKTLEIVGAPYWKAFKQKKIKALEQEYKLARASVEAYRNPAALRTIDFAEACVARFAPPFAAGGDALLGIWREVNEENRRKNSDPERVRREFETKLASADKFRYAQVEVLTFGWWNCVNERIDRADDWDAINRNFKKLFKTVKKIECDEP